MTGRPAGWCPAAEVLRAIGARATGPAPAAGIPVTEDLPDDTVVVEVGDVQRMAAESKDGPVTPPPRTRTPAPPMGSRPAADASGHARLPDPMGSAGQDSRSAGNACPPPAPALSDYEQALADVRAHLVEDICMPPQAVDGYLEAARERRARR